MLSSLSHNIFRASNRQSEQFVIWSVALSIKFFILPGMTRPASNVKYYILFDSIYKKGVPLNLKEVPLFLC